MQTNKIMKHKKQSLRNKNDNWNLTEIPTGHCIAVIGDLIRSRELWQRPAAQESLSRILEHCNQVYRVGILSKFIITAGDEFQGLLKTAVSIPDIIWDIDMLFQYTDIRLGIGLGTLNTKVMETAVGMDGPAWYAARDAIKEAAKHKKGGGVFIGFGETNDRILNGIARLLYRHRKQLTDKQRKVLDQLRLERSQVEIAKELSVTKPVVSRHTQSAGWDVYQEGEAAWRTALSPYDFSQEWEAE